MVKNPVGWKHTKHIDVRLHFARDLQENGTIDVQYTGTSSQVADALTKSLCPKLFLRFRDRMLGVLADPTFVD